MIDCVLKLVLDFKSRQNQQQRRSNIVECYKSNDSFDKVESCFDIVAVFGNKVECCFDEVERCFIVAGVDGAVDVDVDVDEKYERRRGASLPAPASSNVVCNVENHDICVH